MGGKLSCTSRKHSLEVFSSIENFTQPSPSPSPPSPSSPSSPSYSVNETEFKLKRFSEKEFFKMMLEGNVYN